MTVTSVQNYMKCMNLLPAVVTSVVVVGAVVTGVVVDGAVVTVLVDE